MKNQKKVLIGKLGLYPVILIIQSLIQRFLNMGLHTNIMIVGC